MRLATLVLFIFCVGCVHNSVAGDAVWYARMAGFGYSEPIGLRQFTTDWSGRISSGDTALQHVQVESGVEYQDWGAGLFWRDDAEARFSADTAQLYYLLKNKQLLEVGRQYSIDLDVEHARSNGIRIFRTMRFDTWATLILGASLFHSDKLISGTMRGTATVTGKKDYELNRVTVDYYYSRDVLFDRKVTAPPGRGFAFDLDLIVVPAPAWSVHLKTENLFGNIFWKSAPFTQAQVDTDNKTYDENGYVHVKPLLSGKQGNRDYRQRLPLLVDTRVSYNVSDAIGMVGGLTYSPAQMFRSVGAEWRLDALTNLAVLYTFDADMVTLSAHFARGYLSMGADRASVGEAHALTVALGFTYLLGDF